jgi:hypothetical protein
MTNLVPIQLDRDTGRLYARAVTGSGASSVTGYQFTQASAISTWNIAHNLGSETVITQIYDNTNTLIIPDSVVIVDEDNITVTFGAAQAGIAILMAFVS